MNNAVLLAMVYQLQITSSTDLDVSMNIVGAPTGTYSIDVYDYSGGVANRRWTGIGPDCTIPHGFVKPLHVVHLVYTLLAFTPGVTAMAQFTQNIGNPVLSPGGGNGLQDAFVSILDIVTVVLV